MNFSKEKKSNAKQRNLISILFLIFGLLIAQNSFGQIYNADFSTDGDGFPDHTTAMPPATGPASVTGGTAPNDWTLSYTSAPNSDTTPNGFSVTGGALVSDDWGGEGVFQSSAIDVSSINAVDIAALTTNNGANENDFEYFYILDGGTPVSTGSLTSANGDVLNYAISNLDVSSATTLVVGFSFDENGSGDGYATSSFTVTESGTTATCGATLTAGTATCDAVTSGVDTYTATFTVVVGTETSLTVSANEGTPNITTITADGTVTVTGISEGTDVTLTLTSANCSLMETVTSPPCVPSAAPAGIRLNELSFDCPVEIETIEIRVENTFTGNLSDITITLYNGNNGAPYGTPQTLDNFTVGTDDGTYTYYSTTFASIQNGPDAISIDNAGTLIEFLSYEGTFAGVGGPADGVTSTDIGITQSNGSDCLESLQRSDDGSSWSETTSNFGNANGATTPTCTATVMTGTATCDAMTAGVDTYTATFTVVVGSETSLTVAASAGTPSATTITADGTITVTGINEGTDVSLTLTSANCSLMETITSPTCNAAPTCSATLTAGTANCDAMTAAVDTYTATFTVAVGSETSLTVAASAGTPSATTITADGTITVTGINEGTDVTLTLTSANCSLMETVTSPTCVMVVVPTGITAIGTCAGITASSEDTYNITITGLTATTTYNLDLDGNGIADVSGITGVTSYTTTTGIAFVDGTASQMVQIDADADGSYETMVNVHEVLCTDADDDGDLDFGSGCDTSSGMADQGYIVATTAPYNGNNVYVYVLTNPSNNALAANSAGLFTGLASGGNGATTDYNVLAFNFASASDAAAFIAGLTFGTTGTTVTTSTVPTGCSMACGTMAYDIECCVAPIATVNDPTICEGTTSTVLTLTTTAGTPVNYSIDFTDAAITDVNSTAIPSNNMITITLPATLAAGAYTGTITLEEFPGCSGTDDFTITIDPAPMANAGSDEAICADATTFDFSAATTTATAANGTIAWTTNGTGTFDNNTLATPIYTPSAADVTAGSVTLTMTVTSTGTGGCPPAVNTMTLSISPIVTVEAGTGATVCSTGSVDLTTLGASISGGTMTGTWTSTTGGTFDGAGVFGTATTYTPSTAEVAAGSVTLTLTSDIPTGACPSASDTIIIPISNVSCGTFPWDGN